MATRKGFICLDHLDRPPERRAGPRRLLHVQQTLAAPVWIVAGGNWRWIPKAAKPTPARWRIGRRGSYSTRCGRTPIPETELIFMHFVPLWWIKILSPQSHKMQKDDPRVAGIILGIGTIFVGPAQAVMRAPTTGIVLK